MAFDEKIESIELRLNQARDEREKVDARIELAAAVKNFEFERAEKLIDEAFTTSFQINYALGIAKCFQQKGVYAYKRGDYENSLKCLAEAERWFLNIQDVGGYAQVLSNRGLTFWKLGEYSKAMESYMMALPINLQMHDRIAECGTLINIGALYQTMKNDEQSLLFYEQALRIAETKEMVLEHATILSNIGTIYTRKKEYEKALSYYLQSLEIREKTRQLREEGVSLLNIGATYATLGDIEKGLAFMERSLARRREVQDKFGELCVLESIGEVLMSQKKTEAIDYFLGALDIARALQAKPAQSEVQLKLSNFFQETGDFKKALEHFMRHHELEKELFNEEAEQKTRKLMVKYEVEKSHREAELYRLKNEELGKLNRELEEANALKIELLGIAAHDLKNPLQTIMGYSDLIREESKTLPSITAKAATIRRASQKMLGLIQDLLQTAAIDAGKLELSKRPSDLGLLVQLISENFGLMAENKSQQLKLDIEMDCKAEIDAERMKEVIENLISNAIKYSPKGKTILIRCRKHTDDEKHKVIFSVTDEGLGLTAQDKEKLFGKFQRLSAQPTGGESSTGLGLSIAKQLVELHGGRIWAESDGRDKGTTFFVELPYFQHQTVSQNEPNH